MKVYAIGDLHLSGKVCKPMSIFGMHWKNHWEKIKDNWVRRVAPEDVVLIPGDISWAMKLEDARVDLDEIGLLPGKKIIIRGNHDYWWSSISKVRSVLNSTVTALQNDSVSLCGITFCGTRGWMSPGSKDFTPHDLKIFKREVHRLRLSLMSARDSRQIVVLLHYPPFDEGGKKTEIVRVLEDYPVTDVVFGHLHGEGLEDAVEGCIDGINYHLVSCDYLNFDLKLIMEI